ncbi:MAG: hypothetical protein U1E05_04325 [Patescibacteria group bacterium]|nr:hypothetical protein [Patescibacteria group bacterium]
MPDDDAMENPYASPACADPPDAAGALREATARLFRGMGYVGVAYALFGFAMGAVVLLKVQPRDLVLLPMMLLLYGLIMAFFAWMLKTASRLTVDFKGTYRLARWLAILAASIFFPILTIPAVLAVRRLERYREQFPGPADGIFPNQ